MELLNVENRFLEYLGIMLSVFMIVATRKDLCTSTPQQTGQTTFIEKLPSQKNRGRKH